MNRTMGILGRVGWAKRLALLMIAAWTVLGPTLNRTVFPQTGAKIDRGTADDFTDGTFPSNHPLEVPQPVETGLDADDLAAYQQEARDADALAKLSSKREYLGGGADPFGSAGIGIVGIAVEDDSSDIGHGQWVNGVAVMSVAAGSAAARAGLRGRRATVQYLLDGVVVAASVLFPPAFLGVPLLHQSRIGESYDLIIGVDGQRIHDVIDLEDALQKIEPGEIVYLNVLRGRRRLQIPLPLPPAQPPQQP